MDNYTIEMDVKLDEEDRSVIGRSNLSPPSSSMNRPAQSRTGR
jgi:hypothetical protein